MKMCRWLIIVGAVFIKAIVDIVIIVVVSRWSG